MTVDVARAGGATISPPRPRAAPARAARALTRPWAWGLLAVAGGGVLRFTGLAAHSYEHDEASIVSGVLHRSLFDTLSALPKGQRNPPLYYIAEWAWSHAFGTGEAAIRSLSALAGTATILFVFLAARRLAGSGPAIAAAWLTALHPMLVWYSQDGKAYALAACLTALALWCFAETLESRSGRWLAAWAVVAALALATHYFTAFVVGPMAIVLARRLGLRRATGAALGFVALTALALVPLILLELRNTANTADFGQGGVVRRVAITAAQFTGGENPTPPSAGWIDPAFRAAAVVLGLLGAAAVLRALSNPDRSRRPGVILALGLAVAGVGVPALIALAGVDFYNGRSVMFALLPLLVVVGAGAARELRGRPGLLVVPILALQAGFVVADRTDRGLQNPDWRAARQLIGTFRAGDAAIAPRTGDDPLRLYLHAVNIPDEGTPLQRVSVVTLDATWNAPAKLPGRPPPGFRLAGVARRNGVNVYRLVAAAPRRFSDAQWRADFPDATAVVVPR